jgi:hypothetical protein
MVVWSFYFTTGSVIDSPSQEASSRRAGLADLKSEGRRLFRGRTSDDPEFKRSKRDAITDMIEAWDMLSGQTSMRPGCSTRARMNIARVKIRKLYSLHLVALLCRMDSTAPSSKSLAVAVV